MKCWEELLRTLDKEMGRATVDQWLRTLSVVRFDAANLYLEAKDSFQALWFREHMKGRELASGGRKVRIHLAVRGAVPKEKKKREAPAPESYDSDPCVKTFETWLGDDLPAKVLRKIDPSLYNPIYLFGPSGSGKSHLLMATASLLGGRYVRAETFTAHVVRAIRSGDMATFRKAYRSAPALCIDDVDVLCGKAATQEEFFHTFNTLHSAGKPIILSSSLSPRELKGMEERLISRFEWGLSLPCTPYAHLESYLETELAAAPFRLHPTARAFLQTTFPTMGGLSASLETLTYHAALHQKKQYDENDLCNILRHLISEEKQKIVSPDKIVDTVARHFSLEKRLMMGREQKKEIVFPRQIAMYLLRHKLALSYAKIGSLFGRDHSTVMAGVKQIANEARTPDVASALQSIDQILMNG